MTLAALLALQDHDILLDQARHRRAHLPEATRVKDLTAARAALVARRAELAASQADLGQRQAGIERDVVASRAKQTELAKRLGATSVPREAQTLQHELDTAHQRQRDLEDGELELMEQLEPIDGEAASLDERIVVLEAELAEATTALAVRQAEADADVAALVGGRVALAGAIAADALAAYDSRRARLGGVAVARLTGGHCAGCNMQVSQLEQERFRHLPPDEPAECDQCGRLLVL